MPSNLNQRMRAFPGEVNRLVLHLARRAMLFEDRKSAPAVLDIDLRMEREMLHLLFGGWLCLAVFLDSSHFLP